MTINEFLNEIQHILQVEEKLTLETVLHDLIAWDSLAVMTIMGFLRTEFNKDTTYKDYKELQTIQDLVKLAGLADK